MGDFLNVSLVQFNSVWEEKRTNIQKLETLFSKYTLKDNLVVLPEMFLTGFSMQTYKLAEPMEGEMVQWMQRIANQYHFTLIGSLPILDKGKYFNRLLIVSPDNQILWYDKRHLFRMGEEQHNYSAGSKKTLFKLGNWSIMPLVCYDLRFPVWSRNRNLEYNLLIYVANWPEVRNDVFVSLLKARAIENSSYVIGVNRVGTDGSGIKYLGNSVVFDPKGKILAGMIENDETIIQTKISLNELNQYRDKFPTHLDADNFKLE